MLVTIDRAKRHLRVTFDDDNLRIQDYIDQATDIVIDYLKVAAGTYQDVDGQPSGVPKQVEAASLLLIENLYYRSDQDPLSEGVKSLLHRLRDPALA